MDYIINNEAALRLSAFLFILLLRFIIELIFPIYKRRIESYKRWIINFSFVLINTLILRFLFPILAVSFASICIKYNIGIFNYFNFNVLFSVIVSFLFLDLGIWLQHLLLVAKLVKQCKKKIKKILAALLSEYLQINLRRHKLPNLENLKMNKLVGFIFSNYLLTLQFY